MQIQNNTTRSGAPLTPRVNHLARVPGFAYFCVNLRDTISGAKCSASQILSPHFNSIPHPLVVRAFPDRTMFGVVIYITTIFFVWYHRRPVCDHGETCFQISVNRIDPYTVGCS